MEQMSLTPSRRLYARQSYGRAVDAYDTVAWRAPSSRRFVNHAANDGYVDRPIQIEDGMPRWLIVLGGAVLAAVIGALLGGMLAV